ncbi:MAG: NAD-dependent succinate-semialdehyde dehydrogenase [Actinomycetaceae bacterium]|nr:NAD-dependent succinate-semialdehyde dehydrogenase [Actinomycetaceae bacterium]
MPNIDKDELLKSIPNQLFINGEWRDSADGSTLDVINPATEEKLATIASAKPEDGMDALAAASEAQKEWARTSSRYRAELLRDAFELVMERKDDFAAIMTLEMGKPLDQAYGEVTYGGEFLRWFSEGAPRVMGNYYPTPEGSIQVITHKRPVGPSLLITPWNFPFAMATRKVAPALAAGCTTILKPAEITPLTSLLFVKILEDVGVPKGVVNIIPTSSTPEMTGPMIADARLRKLSFTGSTQVGRALLKEASQNVLRTSMELGGLAPFIVFEDADVDLAVEAALATKMRNMGEACNASSRFYVHSDVADEFTQKFSKGMSELVVGDGMEEGVDVGPIVSAKQLASVEDLVTRSLQSGARIEVGGQRLDRPGFFFPPTVLSVDSADNPLLEEEVFGPVAPVYSFDTEEEVLELANKSQYGLAGYVYTNDMQRVIRLGEELQVGMIGVNSGTISNAAAPFGGVKASGLGREGGTEGIEEFLETIYIGTPRG